MRYYNTDAIRTKGAHYSFIIGERSNGKTTALLRDILKDFHETGGKGAVIRQMQEDIIGHKGASLFNAIVAGDMVSELTDGNWSGVKYKNRAYFLSKVDKNGETVVMAEPFCYIFALSQANHYKSNSYPGIHTIVFDEFMNAAKIYLVDEVQLFLNMVSTIVREKDVAKIFLIANTVSWNSPYFKKFGLNDVARMKPGELAVAEFKRKTVDGSTILMRVAIEYCESTASYGGKPSDVYFLIDDERTNMITDGSFAIPEYPKPTHHWKTGDVRCTYWIETENLTLRARLIRATARDLFVFVDMPDEDTISVVIDERRDLFYSLQFSSTVNHYVNPLQVYKDQRTLYLAESIRAGRLFFSSNEVGEELAYFVNQAAQRSPLNP